MYFQDGSMSEGDRLALLAVVDAGPVGHEYREALATYCHVEANRHGSLACPPTFTGADFAAAAARLERASLAWRKAESGLVRLATGSPGLC